jgi:hypothetical protein
MTAVNYTTYDNGDPVARSGGSNAASFPMRHTIENVFDASRRTMAETDTMDLMVIPPNTIVEGVFYEVLEAQATGTLNIGDGGSATRYFEDANVGTKGNKEYINQGHATDNWHATAGKVVLTVPGTKELTTLKIRVVLAVTSFG